MNPELATDQASKQRDAEALILRAGQEALAAIVTWLRAAAPPIRTYVVRRLRKMIAKGELD